MPTVQIQSTNIEYADGDVITFDEGLVGLPHLRRLVIVSQPEIHPFLWLASVEEPETAFLVLEPHVQFSDYAPGIPSQVRARIGMAEREEPLLLVIARITADWQCSTINLRAPLVIAPSVMRGTQVVLTESAYRLDEPLAVLAVAA
jgi:flagellar assembly factor FliW